jgi:hypothetical protein
MARNRNEVPAPPSSPCNLARQHTKAYQDTPSRQGSPTTPCMQACLATATDSSVTSTRQQLPATRMCWDIKPGGRHLHNDSHKGKTPLVTRAMLMFVLHYVALAVAQACNTRARNSTCIKAEAALVLLPVVPQGDPPHRQLHKGSRELVRSCT